jgi:hypothetical protein
VRPSARTSVGTTALWHFRFAVGVFAATAAVELAGQALRGPAGAGPTGWLALLGAGGWVVGLVWRERVGVVRAWLCAVWVMLTSLVVMSLAERRGLLFGNLAFTGTEWTVWARIPLSVPLLWWLVIGGSYLVVEGLWGEWRAGVSLFTALITGQLALMLTPFLGRLRGYWRWLADSAGPPPAGGGLYGMPWTVLAAWFSVGLALAFGLVVLGDNWSSAEARTRRQAWTPAAVLMALTVVCLSADLLAGLWLAVAFSAANGVLFGSVLVWYLRDRGAR